MATSKLVSPSTTAPLRILCLHGYTQSAKVFKTKIYKVRKSIEDLAVLEYEDGVCAAEDGKEESQRSWWDSQKSVDPESGDTRYTYKGIDQSVQRIAERVARSPIDGILGFSQGACFAGVLCAMQRQGLLPFSFQFAIMCGGFPSRDNRLMKILFSGKIALPSLHVMGEKDKMIEPYVSNVLAEVFENPTVHKHPGGHYVPHDAASIQVLREFLKPFADRKRAEGLKAKSARSKY